MNTGLLRLGSGSQQRAPKEYLCLGSPAEFCLSLSDEIACHLGDPLYEPSLPDTRQILSNATIKDPALDSWNSSTLCQSLLLCGVKRDTSLALGECS